MIQKFLRENLFLIAIIVLASILRLWQLGSVPISFSDDEIREVYTAYSIAKTGMDAYGNLLPIVFPIENINTFGPAPIYIRSVFFLFLELSPFSARLPYALASITCVVLLYGIVKRLFNDKKLALISAFVASVSVWQLQMGRFAIETNFGILLLLLGIYTFLAAGNKTKLILLSMFFFFLSFYSYVAFKVIFLPIFLILLWYKYKSLSKNNILITIFTLIFCFVSFAFLTITSDAAKYTGPNGAAFFFQNKEKIFQSVELERRASNIPYPFEIIYHNKLALVTREFAKNYLVPFSADFLVLGQREVIGIYSIWERGLIYWFEFPLFLIGIYFLLKQKKKEGIFILALLLIAPLPSALGIGTPTWMSRSMFFSSWLCVIIAVGIYHLLTIFKKRFVLILVIFAILYLHSASGYLLQYYYDWSRTNAKYFSKPTKDLVTLIKDNENKGKKVNVVGLFSAQNTFLHYAFYNQINPKLVQNNILSSPIGFNNFLFSESCPPMDIKADLVIAFKERCNYKIRPDSQIKTVYNEVIFNIYENK